MTQRYGLLWVAGVIAFACVPEIAPTNPPETPSGGTAGAGGGGGTAGALAGGGGAGGNQAGSSGSATGGAGLVGGSSGVGGATGGAGMTGGAGSGGVSAGTGGFAGGSGGAGAGGSQAGAATGGAGSGGNAGTAGKGGGAGAGSGAGGGSGGSASAMPSEGCGNGGRPSSSNVPNTIVSFPATYDGTNPMPLLIGLHGAGRTNEQFRTADARTQNTVIEEHFVVAYVKSAGSGWVLNTDRTRIDGAYDNIAQNYCIDTNRVFATGHSSGAQMIVQLLCGGYDRFAAIAPVASSVYCQSWDPIPTLLVHGANDTERGSTSQDADGRKDLAPYVASNGCDMTTMPYAVPACTGGSASVNPGCVNYQGCDDTLIWCQHNDPNYSNTNHGWPCFANVAIDAFLMAQ